MRSKNKVALAVELSIYLARYCHFGVSPVNYSDSDIYFRGTGERRPNFEGSSRTKTILGNMDHTIFFSIFGEQRNNPIYLRGTRELVPHWKGLSFLSSSSSLGEISERN